MVKNMFMRNGDESEMQSAKIIAFGHHKGGTGKTTSALNVAGWLVKMKKKVLVIDLDPQGNATGGLGFDRTTIDDSVYDVLFGQRDIREIILEADSGVFVAPSSTDLLTAEIDMAGQINNISLLKKNLDNVESHFDYILLDLPPGSGLLTINGIVASENIIIPLDSGVFAYETMETLRTLLIELNEELGVETDVMMILLRKYSTSIFDKGATRQVRKLLKEFIASNIPDVKIFTIPFSREIYKAQMKGMPISHYAPGSNAGRAYKKIAKEVLKY